MKSQLLCFVLAFPAFGTLAAEQAQQTEMTAEQKAMMEAMEKAGEVRAEHKRLMYFAGSWNERIKMWWDPSGPPQENEAKSTVDPILGGRFIEMRHEGQYNGQTHVGRAIMGYDNVRGKYVNTWIDNMSTGVWVAYGDYDDAKKAYTFNGEMPDPMKPKKTIQVRQVFRVVSEKEYVFEWYEAHGGKESLSMQITYTKQ